MHNRTQTMRLALLHLSLATAAAAIVLPISAPAQEATAAPARVTPQRGTVKAIEGSNLTVATDTGQQVVISVGANARIQRLAPGTTDLKTAESAALTDIAVGDRVLVTGTAGESPASFNATRVILMKSGDIAQRHEAEQQDWQKRGTGGIVSAVDPSTSAITVASGTRKLQIVTTPTTSFRRYADGSVKFEDAKPGTLAQIHPGDQLLARGARSEDGASVTAEEIVSGSFKNLSGTVLSIDSAHNAVSLTDLVTKRKVTVQLTPNSALHRLPPQAATMLAARAKGGAAPTGTSSTGTSSGAPSGAAAGTAPGGSASSRPAGDGAGGGGRPRGPGGSGGQGGPAAPGGTGHSGGGDLSQIVSRLPAVTLSDIHVGDAVMIVAEQSSTDASNLTAITLLAGVEPILAAAPSGAPAMTLSPWSVGTGAPEGGGGPQ